MCKYSIKTYTPKRNPGYSFVYPIISSDSASWKSKGTLLISSKNSSITTGKYGNHKKRGKKVEVYAK